MPKKLPALHLNPGLIAFFMASLVLGIVLIASPYFSFAAQEAPDQTFQTLSGPKLSLKALLGKPVLVTFWASNCAACIKEIPHLLDLYQRYHTQGFEIIAVAMADNPPNTIVEAVKEYQLPYPVALDLKSEHALAFGDIQFTPSTFLIDSKGLIVKKIIGRFDPLTMKEQIETLLKG